MCLSLGVLDLLRRYEDPRTVGLFRIVFGLLLWADVLTLWRQAGYLYFDTGAMPAAEICGGGVAVGSLLCHVTSPIGVTTFFIAFSVVAVSFVVGFRTRIGNRTHPYLSIDRRQKIHAKIRGGRRGYRLIHARRLCRTWQDRHGAPPAEVVLAAWTWPLPDPRWMADYGARDPRAAGQSYRRVRLLLRYGCDAGVVEGR